MKTFNLSDYNFQPFTVTIGNTYKAIGTSGLGKDVEVTGTLSKVENGATATLLVGRQPYQVNAKTLKEV